MFQTDIIHFLQSFDSDIVLLYMRGISETGYAYFYIPFFTIILFGFRFKKGFYLIQAVLFVGIFTEFFKNFFALPRPCEVDSSVLLPGKSYPNTAPYTGMDAPGFFSTLPGDVVDFYRGIEEYSYGFPSGHVSLTTTMWGYAALLFRKRWLTIIAVVIILSASLSRMYLGRHFLADVLGGYTVGSIVLAFAFLFVLSKENLHSESPYKTFHLDKNALIYLSYMIILPFLLYLFLPNIEAENPGRLLGMNIGFLLVLKNGMPDDSGSALKRTSRILMAFLVYFGVYLTAGNLSEILFPSELPVVEFIVAALSTFFYIWGTTGLCVKLGLYKR